MIKFTRFPPISDYNQPFYFNPIDFDQFLVKISIKRSKMVEIHQKQQNPSEILIKSSQIRMFLSKIEMVSKLLIEIRFVIMDFVIMDFVIIDFVSRMQIPTMNLDKKCGLEDHLNFTLG